MPSLSVMVSHQTKRANKVGCFTEGCSLFFFIETNRVFSGVFEIRFFWQRRIPETKSARDSHIQLKKAQEALPLAEFLEIFDILFLR